MKTIADLKRSMIAGSKWHCFNHLYLSDMGIREVSRANSVGVYFWTEKRGEIVESRFDWPKSCDVVFEEETIQVYSGDEGRKRLALTYTKSI